MPRTHPTTDGERKAAYESGLREGLWKSLPFAGRPYIADFPDGDVIYDRIVSYEQRLLRAISGRHRAIERCRSEKERKHADLEAVERQHAKLLGAGEDRSSVVAFVERFFLRRRVRAALSSCAEADDLACARLTSAGEQLEWVYEELTRVRLWLDSFVSAAEAYSAVRPGLRRTPEPEPAPGNVRIYPSSDAYVAENPARAAGDWSATRILDGMDFGYDWTWRDYDRPWLLTQWRVSLIEELGELYAVQRNPDTQAGRYWGAAPTKIDLPVWLFDVRLPASRSSAFSFYHPSPVSSWLITLEHKLHGRPNSLLAFAEAVTAPPDAVTRGFPGEFDDLDQR